MKKNNKKGFTLIEVLAVIIVIGIIAIIAVPTISKYLNQAKDSAYVSYEKSMIDAAKNKVVNCIENNEECDLPEGEEEQKMFLDILIDEGYLENMKDPESNDLCSEIESYVTIKGKTAADYKYKACLACGEYFTDDTACKKKEGDGDPPVCGVVVGGSTRWTNQNRTVTVGCTDSTSGCEQAAFSKTFNKTTKEGIITIRDRSGTSQTCSVNAYVDKTLPTCKIKPEGEYIESTGWWSLEVNAKLEEMIDTDSGILTYGMGTSLKNKDYNKKTNMVIESGITTVIGYTKDVAGNEGICSEEIRVGTEVPKFNMFYGYQIFPNKEKYTYEGLSVTGGNITTSSDHPVITFENMTKYKDIQKVKVMLNSTIQTTTTATLTLDGDINVSGLMQAGDNEILFLLPEAARGTYENISIRFGELNVVQTYSVDRIEILTLNGITWSDKDISVYVEPVDKGMKTIEVSFDNGATWSTNYERRYTEYTEAVVITRNGILMQSEPVVMKALIDKVIPTLDLTVVKTNSREEVLSNDWSSEGLEYKLKQGIQGSSNQTLYYCRDTENRCEPNLVAPNDQFVTDYKDITTDYYFRYKIINEAGVDSGASSFITKFDTVKPTCSISNYATLNCTDTGEDDRISGINAWYYGKVNTSSGQYTGVIVTRMLSIIASQKVNEAGTYYLYVKDVAGNISEVKEAVYYPVTYDKNGGTIDPPKTSDIVRNGQNADLDNAPKKPGHAFAGWNTDPNATMGFTSYIVNGPVTLYATYMDLWARDLRYDDTQTNLGCTDVQCALDKISEKLRNVGA